MKKRILAGNEIYVDSKRKVTFILVDTICDVQRRLNGRLFRESKFMVTLREPLPKHFGWMREIE
jgi:hypothetical protein